MELRHLRYFVAVAEEQNVTRASARLHVSQPAVSRQIRDLEDELGLALLERSAKAVRLTEAGRLFLDEARTVLQRAESAVAKVRASSDGLRGELHVGYAPSLTAQILPRALRKLQASAPGVRVMLHDFSSEEMLAGLRDGTLHVALTVPPGARQRSGLEFRPLARYRLCLAVAPQHRLAGRRSVSLAKIAAEPLITYSRAHYPEYHAGLGKLFGSLKRTLAAAEEHDSVSSLIAAVESGRGVALVTDSLACIAGQRLKLLTVVPAPRPIIVGAVWREGAASLAVQRFVTAASDGGEGELDAEKHSAAP